MKSQNPVVNFKTLICGFILFYFFLPAVFGQDSPRFQQEINNLIAGDSVVNKENIILFTGSSSIRVWNDIRERFPKHNVLNRGFGGSQMKDLVSFVDQLIVPYHPRQIFIYEGDNDIGAGKNPEEVLKDANQLLLLIRKNIPQEVEVLFISPKPSTARWGLKEKYQDYNQLLNAWTKTKENVIFIDVWNPMLDKSGNVMKDLFVGDGLHMNKKGYDIWAEVIGPYIK
ncbi:MAG: G-D-S-L family lipolytic protein [Bacteroidia bacterium]|nr:G-D-S-L family lipolytic protein [Bacteroidia bacterium]